MSPAMKSDGKLTRCATSRWPPARCVARSSPRVSLASAPTVPPKKSALAIRRQNAKSRETPGFLPTLRTKRLLDADFHATRFSGVGTAQGQRRLAHRHLVLRHAGSHQGILDSKGARLGNFRIHRRAAGFIVIAG